MDKAAQADLLSGDPVNFASNTLTIVSAPGNPKKITSFRDLTQPGLSVVVCAPQVPCGSATEKVEKATGVQLNPVSEESQVTDVLGKVTTGQADAGLVYVTDAQGAGDKVTAVAFPESADAVNTYPIARSRAVQESRTRNEIRRPGHRRTGPKDPERCRIRKALIARSAHRPCHDVAWPVRGRGRRASPTAQTHHR